MGHRPTIKHLAQAAGVSVSTVNRVIHSADTVKAPTRELVLKTAEDIGFYGLGAIEHSVWNERETYRLGILLQQPNRVFYQDLGTALKQAAEQHSLQIELKIEFMEDLSPDNVSRYLLNISQDCEVVGLVAAQHPLVSDTIDEVLQQGIPVLGMIGPVSARGNVGYVGLDNWKVGRTAAWAFDKMCKRAGKIGILVGNHRYRNQELNESGFRSYLREHNSEFTLLEPLSTFESAAAAREMTEKLFREHPDMVGLFISGGGITGALAALREAQPGENFVAIGYELIEPTRNALINGTLTMAISHPMEKFARETIEAMVRSKKNGSYAGALTVNLGFDIHTSENI